MTIRTLTMDTYTATYSPEDNKLRLYAVGRLPADLYARVRAAGFVWAPKQELFVAPAWSPAREDLLIELAGEIGDEDTSLAHRAEERAERFGDYSEKRADDAERAHSAVSAIADGIPLGQPILVGHHSERHARKDAEKIENGMRRAVKMWETAEYWKRRAAGAIRAAKYKEVPAVRSRRIKGLESEKRKEEKRAKESAALLAAWTDTGKPLTMERAKAIANYCHVSRCFPLAEYPRELPASQYEGEMSLLSALIDGIITPEQARDIAAPGYRASIASCERWIAHINNRLEYERAMLGESGGIAADKFNLRPGGQVLTRGEWSTILRVNRKGGAVCSVRTNARCCSLVSVEDVRDYRPPTDGAAMAVRAAVKLPPMCNYPGEGFGTVTQERWDKEHKDYKGSRVVEATAEHARHRVRFMRISGFKYGPVYIADAKRTDPPAASGAPEVRAEIPPTETDLATLERRAEQAEQRQAADEPNRFDALRDTLKAGVKVVSAPQLFPTPMDLARRVVDLADVWPGQRVLEPSAGTGNLIERILAAFVVADCGRLVAVEINQSLADALTARRDKTLYANEQNYDVRCADFLSINGELGAFDRIVMNPPFADGADIRHIEHARGKLKPGGRLVAICANGPRQRAKLMPAATQWIDLEPGAFAASGTNVNAAICVFDAPDAPAILHNTPAPAGSLF